MAVTDNPKHISWVIYFGNATPYSARKRFQILKCDCVYCRSASSCVRGNKSPVADTSGNVVLGGGAYWKHSFIVR